MSNQGGGQGEVGKALFVPWDKLKLVAEQVWDNAYAPYSGYQVAAAILFDDGKIISGVNIENASYGATVCAERVALWSGLKDRQGSRWQALYLFTKTDEVWTPCGLCLQVLSEFSLTHSMVRCANHLGSGKEFFFSQLFPFSFSLNSHSS